MSDKKKYEALKEQLKQLIDAAKHDDDVRKLLGELINLTNRSTGVTTGAKRRTPEPAVNPFQIIRESGVESLNARLDKLDVSDLIQIIKYYGLDQSRKSHKWRKKDRIKEFVVERVHAKSVQGDVFSG
jgi:hypothetical protein